MTSQNNDQPGLPDFAIIALRNPPPGLAPLPVRRQRVLGGTNIWHAGHPRGIPLKSGNGRSLQAPLSNNELRLRHNLTVFPGDSGAPIFDEANNQVVAIHVRSPTAGANMPNYDVDPATNTIRSQAYDSAALTNDVSRWCEATRVDYLSWLFDVNARTKFVFSFLDRGNALPDYTLACRLEISVRLHYNIGAAEPVHVVATQALPAGYTQNIEVDISAALQGLIIHPYTITGLSLRTLPPAGVGPTNAQRLLTQVEFNVSNPAVNTAHEYIDFYYTPVNNSDNDTVRGRISHYPIRPSFSRIITRLIH
jgi:hypothetical protein